MKEKKNEGKASLYERFSAKACSLAGSKGVFLGSMCLVIIWAAAGPVFHYSESWQMAINCTTTIITFLVVFLIQKAQNKSSLATHLKLNELVAAHHFSSNRLVDIENLTEEEMEAIKKYYCKLSELSKKEDDMISMHSIDEARKNQDLKSEAHGHKANAKHVTHSKPVSTKIAAAMLQGQAAQKEK